MAALLAAAGLFVYERLRRDLDESLDAGLRSRVAATAAVAGRAGTAPSPASLPAPDDPEDGFAQLLTPEGRLVVTAGGARRPALSPVEARRAARANLRLERRVAGVEATSRVLARPAAGPGRELVAVAGMSLEDRDETLSGLIASFAIGGPLAVLAASGLGYLLAAAGLAPMEAMRRRAEQISLSRRGERLPLPAARDETRRLGETLNEMLDRLEDSFERERRFVADASHELRTPLAVVKTELEAALRSGAGDAATRESLAAAVNEIDHLVQLSEDLLLLARAADGRLAVRLEEVDVGEALGQARARFADRAHRDGRDIAVQVPDGLAARADPLRLRQALANLVDNALRHGRGDIRLAARQDGDGVEIEVSDHGPGFPGDFAPRAFERFARGEGLRSREGAGLGLAIVGAVAEAHGGSATLAGGSTVRLRLP